MGKGLVGSFIWAPMSQLSPEKPPVAKESVANSPQFYASRPLFSWLYAFWKFSRPHTVIGTSLSVLALGVIAGTQFPAPVDLFPAWIACLCGNIYIVGLNQLEDVEIDQINKPHLPIASGEFSKPQGWAIVLIAGVLALLGSAWSSGF